MPNALAIGIDYDLFLRLNPNKIKPFREAFKIKNEREIRNNEFQAYINGVYVLKAIGSAFSKSAEYPKEPIKFVDFTEHKEKTKEELFEELKLILAM